MGNFMGINFRELVFLSKFMSYKFLSSFMKLGWQTVNESIVTETLNMVYKCTNDEDFLYLAWLLDRLS